MKWQYNRGDSSINIVFIGKIGIVILIQHSILYNVHIIIKCIENKCNN